MHRSDDEIPTSVHVRPSNPLFAAQHSLKSQSFSFAICFLLRHRSVSIVSNADAPSTPLLVPVLAQYAFQIVTPLTDGSVWDPMKPLVPLSLPSDESVLMDSSFCQQ
jgi:hypothetical protein